MSRFDVCSFIIFFQKTNRIVIFWELPVRKDSEKGREARGGQGYGVFESVVFRPETKLRREDRQDTAVFGVMRLKQKTGQKF